jgi:hypothetical protein
MADLIALEEQMERAENRMEHEAAIRRARQIRVENLFWRLWGIPMEAAEKIASEAWEA